MKEESVIYLEVSSSESIEEVIKEKKRKEEPLEYLDERVSVIYPSDFKEVN